MYSVIRGKTPTLGGMLITAASNHRLVDSRHKLKIAFPFEKILFRFETTSLLFCLCGQTVHVGKRGMGIVPVVEEKVDDPHFNQLSCSAITTIQSFSSSDMDC